MNPHNEMEISAGNLTFDCRVSGNRNDELVVLLHGFPQTSCMWHRLMRDLSEQGHYCIAPNLRGYSKGARPNGKEHYAVDALATDVTDIVKSTGRKSFHLIGHDWGAVVGWKVVHDYPTAILSWTGLSIPHCQAFGEAVVKDPQQKKMSGYMKKFQWPILPELKIRRNDFEIFRKLWKTSSPAEVEDYLSVFRDRAGLTAALNYYRSNYKLLTSAAKQKILGDIETPTLFVWGKRDGFVGHAAVAMSHQHMKGDYRFLEVDGGHFLIETNYAEVSKAIKEHLAKFKSLSSAR
jgi:pimeloyl-ACP methyl ester carboxylesterase